MSDMTLTQLLAPIDNFAHRHIGSSPDETAQMLAEIGLADLDTFIGQVIPPQIRLQKPFRLPLIASEHAALKALRVLASQNQVFRSYIGHGLLRLRHPACHSAQHS